MVVPAAYMGPIAYYKALAEAGEQEEIEVEAWESFPKRTYRNRCVIAGVNGTQMLTVPVVKCDSKQLTKDVRISYQTPWQRQHWMALKSAYEHTPYFRYYEEYLIPYYEKQWTYLMDFDMELHDTICQLLHNQPTRQGNRTRTTQSWQGKELEWIWDEKNEHDYTEYYQIFATKNGFQKNLSIIDLLMNMGAEGIKN